VQATALSVAQFSPNKALRVLLLPTPVLPKNKIVSVSLLDLGKYLRILAKYLAKYLVKDLTIRQLARCPSLFQNLEGRLYHKVTVQFNILTPNLYPVTLGAVAFGGIFFNFFGSDLVTKSDIWWQKWHKV